MDLPPYDPRAIKVAKAPPVPQDYRTSSILDGDVLSPITVDANGKRTTSIDLGGTRPQNQVSQQVQASMAKLGALLQQLQGNTPAQRLGRWQNRNNLVTPMLAAEIARFGVRR